MKNLNLSRTCSATGKLCLKRRYKYVELNNHTTKRSASEGFR